MAAAIDHRQRQDGKRWPTVSFGWASDSSGLFFLSSLNSSHHSSAITEVFSHVLFCFKWSHSSIDLIFSSVIKTNFTSKRCFGGEICDHKRRCETTRMQINCHSPSRRKETAS